MGSQRLTASDIVVIGDGPAGAATALACVRAGLAVTLVGARRGRLHNAPLQSLNPMVAARLDLLGASHALQAATVATFTTIATYGTERPIGGIGHHVDRGSFDAALLDICAARGVRVIAGRMISFTQDSACAKVGCANGDIVQGRWIVDATGRARRLARAASIGLSRMSRPLTAWTGIRTTGDIPANTSFGPRGRGWLWETPVGDRSTWTTVLDDPAAPSDLRSASLAGSATGMDVTWQLSATSSRGRLLLVGDAAGSLDPATGQGVLNALTSGIVAARTLAACIRDPREAPFHLAGYDDWFSSGLVRGADELRAMYEGWGICFDPTEGYSDGGAAAVPGSSDGERCAAPVTR